MRRKDHEASCMLFLGKPWTEVHAFLDQHAFASEWSKKTGRPNIRHREILHNPEGVEACVQMFGEEARCAAKLHLFDDFEFFNYYDINGNELEVVGWDADPHDILMARIRAEERLDEFDE